MLNGRGVKLVANRFVNGDALLALIAENAHLDQLMRVQAEIDLLENGWSQPIRADQDHGIQGVCRSAQFGAAGRGKRQSGHSGGREKIGEAPIKSFAGRAKAYYPANLQGF